MPVKVTEERKTKKQDRTKRTSECTEAVVNLVRENRSPRGHGMCRESSSHTKGNFLYEKKLPSKNRFSKRVDPKKYPPEPADDDLLK